MVKEGKLAVPYLTAFISQLPEATQTTIRKALEHYSREKGMGF